MHGLRFKNTKLISALSKCTLIIFVFLIFLIVNLVTQADGAYSKEVNAAFIFTKDLNADRLFYVAAHEIGHYVYFKQMNEYQRLEYEKIFNDSNNYITQYSKTNAPENFAEEFAARIECHYNNESTTSLERLNYFNDVVIPIVLTKTQGGANND